MRLEKLFLKMFQVEPRVPVRLLLDTSASMLAHGGMKFDYARKLAAALCYVGLVRLDTIEIQGFAQPLDASRDLHRRTAPLRRRDGRLSRFQASGATDYLASVREFIGAYSQRGLVIIISDFLDDRSCEKALQYLADFGHELMLLQIWADEDRVPPWTGELELRDAETGAGMKLDFDDDARERYTRAFDEYSAGLQTMAMRSGGRYAGVATSQSLESVIFGDLIRVRGIA